VIIRGAIVDMGVNPTLVTQILDAFGSQEIHKGKRAMRFVARLIKAIKIFCFIQDLELFLHLGEPVDTSVPMPQDLFSGHEVVKPDGFENIAVNGCEEIGLFVWLSL
jgi:hypothetical protein